MCPRDLDDADPNWPANLWGKLSAETITNLLAADPDEIRRVLEQFVPKNEVEGMIRRIVTLAPKK